jgi:hypothetical protein
MPQIPKLIHCRLQGISASELEKLLVVDDVSSI